MEIVTPAVTAESITPTTLGLFACISYQLDYVEVVYRSHLRNRDAA